MKAAGKWEAELRDGRYQKPSRMAWEAFREYYSANALPGLAKRTQQTYESTLNVFEEHCKPARAGRRHDGARDGVRDGSYARDGGGSDDRAITCGT